MGMGEGKGGGGVRCESVWGGKGAIGLDQLDSLFHQINFSEWSKRARKRRADARNEGGILAPSVTRKVTRVSRVSLDGLGKKRETAHSLGSTCRLINFQCCLSLPNAFQVRVFVSLSHEDQSSVVHSPSAVWAESISTAGFQLCSRATGSTNDTGIINWVAFQDKPMLTHGSVTFSGIWTTETKCEKVAFSQVR